MDLLTGPLIDRFDFRNAMSHFAAAVHIVTTDGRFGLRGTTVTSVCSVSDDPPTLLVCLNLSSAGNDRFSGKRRFRRQRAGSRAGGRRTRIRRRGEAARRGTLRPGRLGNRRHRRPDAEGALASFDCRVTDSRIVATHRVIIGEVVGLKVAPAAPSLLYKERQFHSL